MTGDLKKWLPELNSFQITMLLNYIKRKEEEAYQAGWQDGQADKEKQRSVKEET